MRAILNNFSDADIRLLKIFIVVADSGGLTAAELELNIGRSTISRHLKDLEFRLGMTLCHRGRAGFALTPEGKTIYDEAKTLFMAIDRFRYQVNDVHKHLQGKLVIAMFDKTLSNPACNINQALARFMVLAPDVEIEIQVMAVNEIEQGLLDGRYHVGVIPIHRPSSSLTYHSLFTEQMWLYCGKGHPLFEQAHKISKAQIKSQRYAGLNFHSPNMEYGSRFDLARRGIANDQEGIATLVASGHFIGFLPDHYAIAYERAGSMRRLSHPEFHYSCEFAAVRKRSPKPARLTALFLEALIAAHKGDQDQITV